ncbi:hypothetical protein R3P38DRAFT_3125976 [Favolaschia claudopus]|uniref:Chromo domain-containing protein n=1 Tax=Favolaschia claudopus TaxID=2862362 RepID=A0AAV9Z9X0_9AGAR
MRKRTRRSTVAVTPREQDDTGKDAYEIEEILKSKRGRSQQELSYLVKWKGYSKAHNSWVPEADMDAPVLVKAFEKRPKAATTSQQVKSRRGRK